jgi:hypothetical protein
LRQKEELCGCNGVCADAPEQDTSDAAKNSERKVHQHVDDTNNTQLTPQCHAGRVQVANRNNKHEDYTEEQQPSANA